MRYRRLLCLPGICMAFAKSVIPTGAKRSRGITPWLNLAFFQASNDFRSCRYDFFSNKDQLRSIRFKRLQFPAPSHEIEKLRAIGKSDEAFRPKHAGRQTLREALKTMASEGFVRVECERLKLELMCTSRLPDLFPAPETE